MMKKEKLFYQHILFDLDGTLLDSAKDIINAVKFVLKEYKINYKNKDNLVPLISKGVGAMLRKALGEYDIVDLEGMTEQVFNFYENNLVKYSKIYNGVYELLEYIENNNAKYSIVTSKPYYLTKPILKHFLINPHILVCGDTLKENKPNPAPILYALEKSNVAAENTIMIGDDQNDMQAAKRSAVFSIFANYGYGSSAERFIDKKINKPQEIIQFL